MEKIGFLKIKLRGVGRGDQIKQNSHQINPKISNGEERELMNSGRGWSEHPGIKSRLCSSFKNVQISDARKIHSWQMD